MEEEKYREEIDSEGGREKMRSRVETKNQSTRKSFIIFAV